MTPKSDQLSNRHVVGWLRPAIRRWPASLRIGLLLLLVQVLVAVFADYLYPGDPFDLVGMPFTPPGDDPLFSLGTDILGRDIAAMLAHGARTSLAIGLIATLVASAIGTCLGLIAGYVGGWFDHLIMRFTELFQVVPHFLLAMILLSIMGPQLPNIVMAVGLTSWSMVARMVRAETLKIREMDFVKIAVVMGGGHARAVLIHVLPNTLGPIVTAASILSSLAVLTEAGLAFLGLNDSNFVSWGGMMGTSRDALLTAPYMTIIPGLAIVTTVGALSLVGDGVSKLTARGGGV